MNISLDFTALQKSSFFLTTEEFVLSRAFAFWFAKQLPHITDGLGDWHWIPIDYIFQCLPTFRELSRSTIYRYIAKLINLDIIKRHPDVKKYKKSLYKFGSKYGELLGDDMEGFEEFRDKFAPNDVYNGEISDYVTDETVTTKDLVDCVTGAIVTSVVDLSYDNDAFRKSNNFDVVPSTQMFATKNLVDCVKIATVSPIFEGKERDEEKRKESGKEKRKESTKEKNKERGKENKKEVEKEYKVAINGKRKEVTKRYSEASYLSLKEKKNFPFLSKFFRQDRRFDFVSYIMLDSVRIVKFDAPTAVGLRAIELRKEGASKNTLLETGKRERDISELTAEEKREKAKLAALERHREFMDWFEGTLPRSYAQTLVKGYRIEWARTLERILRSKKYHFTIPLLYAVIKWARRDPFWTKNFRSISKLLKRSKANEELYLVMFYERYREEREKLRERGIAKWGSDLNEDEVDLEEFV